MAEARPAGHGRPSWARAAAAGRLRRLRQGLSGGAHDRRGGRAHPVPQRLPGRGPRHPAGAPLADLGAGLRRPQVLRRHHHHHPRPPPLRAGHGRPGQGLRPPPREGHRPVLAAVPRHPRPGRGASGRIVGVCHVLRYTPYFRMMRHIVASGRLGEVVGIQHLEPVEHIHMSHSFVRGNWRNSRESNPDAPVEELSRPRHPALDRGQALHQGPVLRLPEALPQGDGPARSDGPLRRRLSRRGRVPVLGGRDLPPPQDLARPQGHARRRRRLHRGMARPDELRPLRLPVRQRRRRQPGGQPRVRRHQRVVRDGGPDLLRRPADAHHGHPRRSGRRREPARGLRLSRKEALCLDRRGARPRGFRATAAGTTASSGTGSRPSAGAIRGCWRRRSRPRWRATSSASPRRRAGSRAARSVAIDERALGIRTG
ncbi:MAG: hypothetical protein MZU91_11375 [Desulfosudis oleivorans]|nr:hypothetical protein [Desulfosudis oleivorans]